MKIRRRDARRLCVTGPTDRCRGEGTLDGTMRQGSTRHQHPPRPVATVIRVAQMIRTRMAWVPSSVPPNSGSLSIIVNRIRSGPFEGLFFWRNWMPKWRSEYRRCDNCRSEYRPKRGTDGARLNGSDARLKLHTVKVEGNNQEGDDNPS